ncbi:urease accessory protein UreF [Rubrobacter aplysinae]|uniref:urease accessory protein UreF n=1 Tax=Rubrobacter aplysinae TaxID=909625 RepID=UPI00064C011B|nr:urease accessory UreF family protein [Rubrobacter aplysinae]
MGSLNPQALLGLLQISDSAFPTGAFAHSLGLEAFQAAGELEGKEHLARAVSLHLEPMATSDCVALRAARTAGSSEELVHADRLLAATRPTRELRQASAATGRRFAASVVALGVEDELLREFAGLSREGGTPGSLAVAHGVAARALGTGVEEALHAYLYASAAALVAAGQKLIPLGGGAAQRVLFELRGKIQTAVQDSERLEVEDMYTFAPLVDARSMQHERQRVRLFVS